jgi:hypothetical protein
VFISGWMSNITVNHVPLCSKDDHLVMARVKHSQKFSTPFVPNLMLTKVTRYTVTIFQSQGTKRYYVHAESICNIQGLL